MLQGQVAGAVATFVGRFVRIGVAFGAAGATPPAGTGDAVAFAFSERFRLRSSSFRAVGARSLPG